MSPPPPLYPQPISIVTTSPGGVGVGLQNVVLSPGRAEIMSPGRVDVLSPGRTEIMSPGVILSPTGILLLLFL